jgi:hypothetical protein
VPEFVSDSSAVRHSPDCYRVPAGAFDLTLPPEELLAPDNIGPGGVTFDEETQPRDTFRASQRIIAGYGLLELPLIAEQLRFVGGTRYEDSHIRLNTFDVGGNDVHPVKDDGDWLPGANLISCCVPARRS